MDGGHTHTHTHTHRFWKITHICPEKADTTSSQWASLVAQTVKTLPKMRETWAGPLGWEDPWEEGTATHSVILLGALAVCQATSQDHKDKGLVFNGVYKALSQCHPNRRKRTARTRPPPPPRPECVVPGVGVGAGGRASQVCSKALPEFPLNSLDGISNKGGMPKQKAKSGLSFPPAKKYFLKMYLVYLLEVRKCFLAIILPIPIFPSVFIPDPISPHLHSLLAVSTCCQ